MRWEDKSRHKRRVKDAGSPAGHYGIQAMTTFSGCCRLSFHPQSVAAMERASDQDEVFVAPVTSGKEADKLDMQPLVVPIPFSSHLTPSLIFTGAST